MEDAVTKAAWSLLSLSLGVSTILSSVAAKPGVGQRVEKKVMPDFLASFLLPTFKEEAAPLILLLGWWWFPPKLLYPQW